MNTIHVRQEDWTNSFLLPSHYTVGPTAAEPYVDASAIRQTRVAGLPLPIAEDYSPDAFGGKYFVRMPRRTPEETHVSGRVARLRRDQPTFGAESMWLPDWCVVAHGSRADHTRVLARQERKRDGKRK